MAEIATIRETAARLSKEGFSISEYSLRRWVRTGTIPSVRCGVKALLYYPNVLTYIQGGNIFEAQRQDADGVIRRIKV